jgi:DNA-binding LacI/PurR family transcriptional regulator
MPDHAPIVPLSRSLLYETVAEKIRDLVKERDLWGSYLSPERELAQLLGVNRGTLRKGLDLLKRESFISREQGRGTRVRQRPGNKSNLEQRRIAVASFARLPLRDGYFGEIMAGVTVSAGDLDWKVAFHSGLRKAERWDKFMAALDDQEIDGLLLISFTEPDLMKQVIDRWQGPLVLIDHYYPDLPVTSVIDDSCSGARMATEHLLSLGHRRIGYLDDSKVTTNPWRYSSHVQTLKSAGIEVDAKLRVGCHSDVEQAREAAMKLLTSPQPPTAILAFNDTRAWGVWTAAEERDLRVGTDFALVGYGDTPPPPGRASELSTVHIEPQAMGEVAVNELERIISGEVSPGKMIELPARLIVRKSSRGALFMSKGITEITERVEQ